jgi:hypothetical protein
MVKFLFLSSRTTSLLQMMDQGPEVPEALCSMLCVQKSGGLGKPAMKSVVVEMTSLHLWRWGDGLMM